MMSKTIYPSNIIADSNPLASAAEIDALLCEARALYRIDCRHTLQLAERAALASKPLAYAAGIAHAHLLIGQAQLILLGAEHALPMLRAALTKTKPWPLWHAECLISLASCQQDNPHQAFGYFLDALETALGIQAYAVYVEAYLGLGNLFVTLQEYTAALPFLVQASEWSDLSRDQDLRCKANIHLAALLVRLQQLPLAEQVLQQASQQLILPLRRNWQAEIFNYLGQINVLQQRWQDAERFYEAAYAIHDEAGFLWEQTVNLLGLGRLKRSLNQSAAAEAYLQQALQLGDQLQSADLLQQIHNELYQLFEARGDYIRAMMHHIGFHDHAILLLRQDAGNTLSASSERRLKSVEMKLKLLATELEVNQLKQQRDVENVRVQQLESAAYRDGLTGVYNRRALDERLPDLIASAEQSGDSLWAIMVDFDHFKHVNDDFSHHIGDVVLQAGCKILADLTRESDIFARYGGEEFVLILNRLEVKRVEHIAERMRQSMAQFAWDDVQVGLNITISLGCARWRLGDSVEALLSRADAALYCAKREGRNCVRFADDINVAYSSEDV